MKIRRYKERIATDWILDAEMGDWCRYEEVEPLLERIKELEKRQCDGVDWVDNVDNAALDIIAVERAEVLSLRKKVEELENQLEFESSLEDRI